MNAHACTRVDTRVGFVTGRFTDSHAASPSAGGSESIKCRSLLNQVGNEVGPHNVYNIAIA